MDGRLTVEVKVLDERIREWGLPQYESDMAAGLDLRACIDDPIALEPQSPAQLVPSGISVHIADPTIAAIIVPRSGLGHRTGLVLGNSVGVIDADYTGPVLVSVWNRNAQGTRPIVIAPGDRIAQMLFLPVVRPALVRVDEFTAPSQRGHGGFGSTGT